VSALAACVEPPAKPTLTAVAYDDLPGWSADRHAEALPVLARSCAALTRRGGAGPAPANLPAAAVPADAWQAACAALAEVPPGDDGAARTYFERWFMPYAVSLGDDPEGLFTGYYESELNGAWSRDESYRVPIHARPDDLVDVDLGRFLPDLRGRHIVGQVVGGRLQPYPARAEIVSGAAEAALPVLLWVDDPADAFVLHIQGSGRVRFPDGGTVRIGYAGNNGRPFVSIGRILLDDGLISPADANMQAIRRWLRENPDKAKEVLDQYPRYIFFRLIEGEGPIGAQGVALTAGRSLAVDTAILPLGAPVWLDTRQPGTTDVPLRRLMVAQDAGGAIKGAVRGDIFWGTGEAALAEAGRMKQKGHYYLLLPRAAAAGS